MEEHCARLRSQLFSLSSFFEALVRSDFTVGTVYVPPRGGFIHWMELPEHTDMSALERLASERSRHVAPATLDEAWFQEASAGSPSGLSERSVGFDGNG